MHDLLVWLYFLIDIEERYRTLLALQAKLKQLREKYINIGSLVVFCHLQRPVFWQMISQSNWSRINEIFVINRQKDVTLQQNERYFDSELPIYASHSSNLFKFR